MKLLIVVLFLSTTTFVVGIENKDATTLINQTSPIENKIASSNQSSPIENKNSSLNQSSPANETIPHEPSKLDEWIQLNMNEFKHREPTLARGFKRSILDHALVNAEQGGIKLIRVKQYGGGDFTTVNDAVKSIPIGNDKRVVVWIGGGEYMEKVTVEKGKIFVTFYGDPKDIPRIVFNGTAEKYGTVKSATVTVNSDYFVAVNISFVNSAPPEADSGRKGAHAVAMRVSGDKAAFHSCKFIGYQDTVCDDNGKHFFKDCYIQGTLNFIFGYGNSLFMNITVESAKISGKGVITTHSRKNVTVDSGFVFAHSGLIGSANTDTYISHAWREQPRVVFAHSFMGTVIRDKVRSHGNLTEHNSLYYGEYKCKGLGASPSSRVKHARRLSEKEVKPFLSTSFIHGGKWLLPPPTLDAEPQQRPQPQINVNATN